MLVHLSVRNLAVIENIQVAFGSGFHVLTGETGAGKSIIIDALSLVIGGRGSSELVRHGSDKAEIEALFELDPDHPVWNVLGDYGIEASAEEQLMIRREITVQGKSAARINGQLVNLSMLRAIGEWLVNIHGQHEHQSLLKVDEHLPLLDLFGGANIQVTKKLYQESFKKYNLLLKEYNELQKSTQQTLQMMDLYRFQIDEISAAKLTEGEEEQINEERGRLANAEKLYEAVTASYEAIYGQQKGLDWIGKAMSRLETVAVFDTETLQPLLEQIRSCYYQLEDASYQLRSYCEQIEFNPARLDQLEQRLNLLSGLRRKYGQSIGEIISHLRNIEGELALAENKDDKISRLQSDANMERERLLSLANQLSTQRKQMAEKLARRVETELRDLQMEKTRFQVHIDSQEGVDDASVKLSDTGRDRVEFLISANPGEPLRPLGKIASGGEISRVMLALKSIFAAMDRIPVLVFDEVDTGVSGRAAQAIAEKISRLSGSCQVFSITHLPQVACMADIHYLIQKDTETERTFTQIYNLEGNERIVELARMLGGVEVTETTKHHAQEMILLADRKKSSL